MRYFYVDTENRSQGSWVNNIHQLKTTDVVYIIYTNNSPKLTYESIWKINQCKAKLKLVRTENGTQNALDFVLITKLAEQCISAPKSKHFIISDDKGYTPVVTYHTHKGIYIRQVRTIHEAMCDCG